MPAPSASGDAIAVDHLAIDLDAKAGAGRYCDTAPDLDDRLERQMVAERIFLLLELQHRRHRKQAGRLVRYGSEEMNRGGKSDGRAPGMRYAFDAVGGGERGDLLALGDAAGRTDVRLDDVHRLAHDGIAKTPAG